MRVHDLMIRDVAFCSPSAFLDEAVAVMVRRDIGFLPVVDGATVVGVLTERDVAQSAWRSGVALSRLRVANAMCPQPVVVDEEAPIERAEELMATAQVHRLPVVGADGRLVGVVSLGDLARAPRRGGSSHRDDVVQTLSALSRRAR